MGHAAFKTINGIKVNVFRSTRRPRVAAAAAAVGVAVAVWAVHPWASESPGSAAASKSAVNSAGVSLQHLGRGQTAVVVPVGAGFEAATYDQHGRLDFWADTAGSWVLQAARTYQDDPPDSQPGRSAQDVTVSGALLPGMSDATFAVSSPGFSGDGSGTAKVYARGELGWGIIAQQGTWLVPTGRSGSSAQDTFLGAWLLPAGLRTSKQSYDFGSPTVGAQIPLVDYWRWDNGRFDLARTNALTATVQPSPGLSGRPLPWGMPGTGTYGGVLQGVVFGPALPGEVQPVVVLYVLPAVLDPACLQTNKCPVPKKRGYLPSLRFTLGAQTPLDYAATTSSGTMHIRGPAWFLALVDPYPQGNLQTPQNSPYSARPANPGDYQGGMPADYDVAGVAPWYIPPRLGLRSFRTIEGYVQLTFKDGGLVHASVY